MIVHEIQKVDLASFCYKNKDRYPFLLESVNHNDNNRYSLLFAFPGEKVVLNNLLDFDFLSKLNNLSIQNNINPELPFTGGWFIYLSYELIGQIEPILAPINHNSNLPIAYAVRVPTVIYTDHKLGKTFLYDEEDLCIEFCEDFEYTPVVFTSYQTVNDKREEIYHTNVMMCLAETFAVICLDSIDNKKERKNVLKHLKEDGKKIIEISEDQVNNFAGNMLQVRGANDELFLVMSKAAHDSLNQSQLAKIGNHCKIISSSLDTIEACGGGSARCMMAEIFLPKEN